MPLAGKPKIEVCNLPPPTNSYLDFNMDIETSFGKKLRVLMETLREVSFLFSRERRKETSQRTTEHQLTIDLAKFQILLH